MTKFENAVKKELKRRFALEGTYYTEEQYDELTRILCSKNGCNASHIQLVDWGWKILRG